MTYPSVDTRQPLRRATRDYAVEARESRERLDQAGFSAESTAKQ